MRIYAFADLHGNAKALARIKKEVKERKPDLVVCIGDLTVFEHDMEALLSRLQTLKVPVLMLHGNHESESRMRDACKRFPNITFLHKETVQRGGYTFAAYGGGGFDDVDPALERLVRSWRKLDWSRTVLLSHAPPHGTTLDDIGEPGESWHVGSRTLTRIVRKRKPLLLLAGHIHEAFRKRDSIAGTPCENPGPSGRLYDLGRLRRKR